MSTFILQIAVVLVCAKLIGWVFQKFHQPRVIGEMLAGILLGPSLFGAVAPDLFHSLFAAESLGQLNALSQVGLWLFLFLVGLELDPRALRERGRVAVISSQAGIIVPFLSGALLAIFLYPRLSLPGVPIANFALFVGTAMSITAFPVLARILSECNLTGTPIGTLAIACAAVDDVCGWFLLSAVVLLIRASGDAPPLWLMTAGFVAYLLLMIFVVRPAARKLQTAFQRKADITYEILSAILLILLASAWITETLGLHALFGAFFAGIIMPKEEAFVSAVLRKMQSLTVVLLLPLYFAFTGLRTSIGLLNTPQMWLYCALIIGTAIAGKFGGVTLASRASGMNWREASALGILMNTRGLMELVILNIGLDMGVLSPLMFTMMVMMALTTTFMAPPLLHWIYQRK